ncbi:unnamed protein product, partial [Sphagnum tenellum]
RRTAPLPAAEEEDFVDVVVSDLGRRSDPTSSPAAAALKVDFYKNACPQLHEIVQKVVATEFQLDPTSPGPQLRLFFHDCFVGGCDASVLLNSTDVNQAEKDAAVNFSLGSFFVIDEIKQQLEQECPGVVSCADVLALVAVYSVKQAGGPLYEIDLGRRDGLTSYAASSETFLPAFSLNVSGLLEDFHVVGLNLLDLVVLSGAHTIGQSHCSSIINRIHPRIDPEYPKYFGQELLANCTDNGAIRLPNYDSNTQFFNDPVTPLKFDNQYFKNLKNKLCLFTSDMSLFNDADTRKLVEHFSSNQEAFFEQFGISLHKMGRIGVLTGTQGQIRKQLTTMRSLLDTLRPPLEFGFYHKTCPQLPEIVKKVVTAEFELDPTSAGPQLRLFFHDCFVQGCDGSVLLNSTKVNQAEKDASNNFSLSNFFVIDEVKEQLEKECPGVVSCADVLALVAVYSVQAAGGPLYAIELGRRDSLTSYSPSAQTYLPGNTLNVSGLLEDLQTVGLDEVDLVALSGAHTIGQAHCNSIVDRLYPQVDPQYPKYYSKQLVANCTDNGYFKLPNYDNNTQFFNDPITPTRFDNQYFKNLEANLGLFTSDESLFNDERTRKLIRNQCWVRNSHNVDPALDPASLDFVS